MLHFRHHCRKCGAIVCANCSANTFHIPAVNTDRESRVCDSCFKECVEQNTSFKTVEEYLDNKERESQKTYVGRIRGSIQGMFHFGRSRSGSNTSPTNSIISHQVEGITEEDAESILSGAINVANEASTEPQLRTVGKNDAQDDKGNDSDSDTSSLTETESTVSSRPTSVPSALAPLRPLSMPAIPPPAVPTPTEPFIQGDGVDPFASFAAAAPAPPAPPAASPIPINEGAEDDFEPSKP
jgi:hypothetical protein